MKKDSKQLLFERMHSIGGMSLKENDPKQERIKRGRQRVNMLRKLLKQIHPDLGVQSYSQGYGWTTYWLMDLPKNNEIDMFKDEYQGYIADYSDEDFNKMIDKFKKRGEEYIKNKYNL
jgi:hypothetical protein